VEKTVASKRMAYLMSDMTNKRRGERVIRHKSVPENGCLTGTVNPPVKATRFRHDVRVTDGGEMAENPPLF
jgi:hypothetical protein